MLTSIYRAGEHKPLLCELLNLPATLSTPLLESIQVLYWQELFFVIARDNRADLTTRAVPARRSSLAGASPTVAPTPADMSMRVLPSEMRFKDDNKGEFPVVKWVRNVRFW